MIMATNAHFRDLADWSGTTPPQLIEAHLEKPANTRRGYQQDLRVMAAWLGADGLPMVAIQLLGSGRGACKRRLIAWVNHMRTQRLAANTIRRRVAGVTSMVSLAADLDIVGWQVGRLPNLPPAVRVRDCQGPDLGTVERMFIACRDRADEKGARDEAMLGLLYWHALRAAEVLSIRLADVDLAGRTVRILAKRGQGRMTLRLCQRAAVAVERWIEFRGEDAGPLFRRCKRGRCRVMSTALSYWGLRGVVRDLGAAAGGRCWPHALRHAAVSHLAALTSDSPTWGCALSRHKDVRAWQLYRDPNVSHVSAAEVLSRGQIVRREPQDADN